MKVKIRIIFIGLFILALSGKINAQHNGDPLSYQGILNHQIGINAVAMGGAFVSQAGEIDALFTNPAGLTGIHNVQLTMSAVNYNKTVRENNVWYPGAPQKNLSLLMDGLLTLRPEQSGVWESDLGDPTSPNAWTLDQFAQPVMGKYPYSEDVADFERTLNDNSVNNFALAVPFTLAGKTMVAAAAYQRQIIREHDWNGSHLDPHFGTSELLPDVDTLKVNWSEFNRKRSGALNHWTLGVSYPVTRHISVGLSVNQLFGETDDQLSLAHKGFFLMDNVGTTGDWSFTSEPWQNDVSGTSKFSSTSFNFGLLWTQKNFNLGVNIKSPATIKREWEYQRTINDESSSFNSDSSGVDKLELPTIYSLGISFKPTTQIIFSLQYEFLPLGNTTYNFEDDVITTEQKWVDQQFIRAGVKFNPIGSLALMAGVWEQSEAFVPTGNAISERGPISRGYTVGLSYKIFIGQFIVAFSNRQLKYYDIYVNNRNYAFQNYRSIYIGYDIQIF